MVLTVLATAAGLSSALAATDTPGDFDSFVLEQSWQPQFCAGEHYPGCQPTAQTYMKTHLTLHGLWPQYDKARGGATYPQNCASTPFDPAGIDKVAGGRAAMFQYWPNVKVAQSDFGSYTEFWAHEWGKHGTCTTLAEPAYFSAALKAEQALGTPQLISANINGSVAKAALQKAYGGAKYVSLSCSGGELSAVATCYALDNQSGEPGAKQPCPPAVLAQDSCSAEKIGIVGFGGSKPAPPTPPGPPSPGPPSPGPPAGECKPHHKGPKCSTNRDCKKYLHCIRCAHSGYCTEEK